MRCSIILTAIVLLVPGLRAQVATTDAVVARIIEEGSSERSQVMAHLDYLTNRIGPRLTGSDRLTEACEWAVDVFQGFGLTATKEEWGTFPVGFNRGPWFGSMVAPKQMALTFTTSAWSSGTNGRQRGEAVFAPMELEGVEALAGQLAGKWVLAQSAPRRRRSRRGEAPAPDPNRGAFARLETLCREEGALGIIRTSGQEIVTTGGNWRISYDDLPKDIRITLVNSDFLAITGELERGENVVLEFDIRNHFRRGPIPLYNVIAELRGTDLAHEVVVVGGHIDSWDGATGTTDNGTGTSTTIEAARILAAAGAQPRRTIRFMLWSGEEQGLLGSAAWCKAHQDELANISAVLVHDGGTNYVSGIRGTPSQVEDLRTAFAPCIGLDPELPFEVGEVGTLRGGGSDHGSYLAYGVPGYFWNQAGRAVYRYGWHTQNDTYDIAIPEYQRHSAKVIALGAYGIANLPNMLSREGMRSTAERPRLERTLGVHFEGDSLAVTGFTDDAQAAKAGVKQGDVLLELDGVVLKGDRFILRAAANNGEPKKVLLVQRGDERVSLEITWPR